MQPIKVGTKELLNNFNNLAKPLKQLAESGENIVVDLHIHTSESHETGCDFTPKETLERLQALAELLNTKLVISITDHETITGSKKAIEEMQKNPEKYNRLTCISGIEFNTSLKSIEVKDGYSTYSKLHMLGLGCDVNNHNLHTYSQFSQIRFNRTYPVGSRIPTKTRHVNTGKQIIASIHALERTYKIKLNYSTFINVANKETHQEMRDEFLRISKEYFQQHKIDPTPSIEETLQDVFMPNTDMYGEQAESLSKIDIIKCIQLINSAGGKAVIAHPNSVKYEQKHHFGKRQHEHLRKLVVKVQELSQNGLSGLEIFHSSNFHGKAVGNLFAIANEHNLYISGGSDYHGNLYRDKSIGAVFSREFNKLVNKDSGVKKSSIPNRLAYTALIDNIVFNINHNNRTDFLATSLVKGNLTQEYIVGTALSVGDIEKEQKKTGNFKGLEEEVVTNIYKGKPLKKKHKHHKEKSHKNKNYYKQQYLKEEYGE